MSDVKNLLLGLYDRFNDDVQLLLANEETWKVCSLCPDSHCCKRETVPVMGIEWDNIIEYVKSAFSQNNKRIFQNNVDRGNLPCPFLIHNRCSVYPVRPWACRIFPYTISFRKNYITQKDGVFYAPHCPSLAPLVGGKVGQIIFLQPLIQKRLPNSKLVQVQVNGIRPFWLIDITSYQEEYEAFMPKNEYGTLEGDDMHNWVGLLKRARDSKMIDQTKFLQLLGLD